MSSRIGASSKVVREVVLAPIAEAARRGRLQAPHQPELTSAEGVGIGQQEPSMTDDKTQAATEQMANSTLEHRSQRDVTGQKSQGLATSPRDTVTGQVRENEAGERPGTEAEESRARDHAK
jgi:hypothetical protein